MSILTASLLPKDIKLHLKATDHRDALEETLSSLRRDSRIRDWEKLRSALLENSHNFNSNGQCPTIVLHHARTEFVTGLLLAVGRSLAGVSSGMSGEKVHLVFVAAIPFALNNEYLRVLGAVSRVCRQESTYRELLSATDPSGFMTVLEKGCLQ
jgi:PTS system fructose-specific IIC component